MSSELFVGRLHDHAEVKRGNGLPTAQHFLSMNFPISSGEEKIAAARSPSIPADMIAGAPLCGPSARHSRVGGGRASGAETSAGPRLPTFAPGAARWLSSRLAHIGIENPVDVPLRRNFSAFQPYAPAAPAATDIAVVGRQYYDAGFLDERFETALGL